MVPSSALGLNFRCRQVWEGVNAMNNPSGRGAQKFVRAKKKVEGDIQNPVHHLQWEGKLPQPPRTSAHHRAHEEIQRTRPRRQSRRFSTVSLSELEEVFTHSLVVSILPPLGEDTCAPTHASTCLMQNHTAKKTNPEYPIRNGTELPIQYRKGGYRRLRAGLGDSCRCRHSSVV